MDIYSATSHKIRTIWESLADFNKQVVIKALSLSSISKISTYKNTKLNNFEGVWHTNWIDLKNGEISEGGGGWKYTLSSKPISTVLTMNFGESQTIFNGVIPEGGLNETISIAGTPVTIELNTNDAYGLPKAQVEIKIEDGGLRIIFRNGTGYCNVYYDNPDLVMNSSNFLILNGIINAQYIGTRNWGYGINYFNKDNSDIGLYNNVYNLNNYNFRTPIAGNSGAENFGIGSGFYWYGDDPYVFGTNTVKRFKFSVWAYESNGQYPASVDVKFSNFSVTDEASWTAEPLNSEGTNTKKATYLRNYLLSEVPSLKNYINGNYIIDVVPMISHSFFSSGTNREIPSIRWWIDQNYFLRVGVWSELSVNTDTTIEPFKIKFIVKIYSIYQTNG